MDLTLQAQSPSQSPSESSPVCRVEHVLKSFDQVQVLRGVSFSIQEGERVALMGPSGCGKSTLLNCLSGIEEVDDGRIYVGQTELGSASSEARAGLRRSEVSTVFQFFHLLPTLTAEENIEISLQLQGGFSATERKDRVQELLEAVGLPDRAAAFPETLSGGERQRIALARAMAHRPRLLLADEPTGSLDSVSGSRILDLLEELCAKHRIAMLLVTHSEEATRICDRCLRMQDGRLVGEA